MEVGSRLVSPNVHPLVVALALLVGAPACAGAAKPTDAPATKLEPAAATPAPESPETTFVRLEERLGRAPWRLRFTIEAEGAVVASLAGMLELGDGDLELRAAGSFAGAAQDVRLWTEGDRLRSASSAATSSSTPALDVPRPPELESAVVVGMARMGPRGPTNEMRVVERYEWLEPLPPAAG